MSKPAPDLRQLGSGRVSGIKKIRDWITLAIQSHDIVSKLYWIGIGITLQSRSGTQKLQAACLTLWYHPKCNQSDPRIGIYQGSDQKWTRYQIAPPNTSCLINWDWIGWSDPIPIPGIGSIFDLIPDKY
ncbi:hypothetical protein PGT21_032114 [Puccinia graminis f. sp. tritici]|uniref:Uncharacterized protein n=1 Tax=Puccinia graminis f. sp. tritici TaxID=56615 RepID=A0A5B0MQF1_PUCGR|nr:hypothetical protein PGT21_032114 [Puccinia graminis f. sp. tritici]